MLLEYNQKNLKVFSLIAAPFLLVMFGLSFPLADVVSLRWSYLACSLFALAMHGIARFARLSQKALIKAGAFLFAAGMLLFGVLAGTCLDPDDQALSYVVLLLLLPLLFTDRPFKALIFIFASLALFIVLVLLTEKGSVAVTDILNASLYACVASVVTDAMR